MLAPNAEAVVQHPRLGPVNYAGWFARCAAHDDEHRAQIEAALGVVRRAV